MKRWQILLALGLTGVASLALIPIRTLIDTSLPEWQLTLAFLLQPAVLVGASVAIGEWSSGRAGLGAPLIDAWLSRADPVAVLRRQIGPATGVAFAVAGVLILYAQIVGPRLVPEGELAALASFEMPLATKLLYGGISEEILTRWALMSFVVAVVTAVAHRRRWTPAYPVAILVSAAAFAAAHLPLLFLIVPEPQAWIVAAVLLGNAIPGAAFGWLYWRRGLEAAMIAHALAHLLATVVLSFLP